MPEGRKAVQKPKFSLIIAAAHITYDYYSHRDRRIAPLPLNIAHTSRLAPQNVLTSILGIARFGSVITKT